MPSFRPDKTILRFDYTDYKEVTLSDSDVVIYGKY